MKSNKLEFHEIWADQCEAAEEIRNRYGLLSAMDYLVGTKLFDFVAASEKRSQLAAELPHLVDDVRGMFTAKQIDCYLDELECSKFFAPSDSEDDPDLDEYGIRYDALLGAEEILRFARIKEMFRA
ncbi:MAG: hypothetical protein WA532_01815 [Candidatus Korobacteraceae bacterium]